MQEFEPEVRLELNVQPFEGWLKPDDIQPRATVAHLFGEPATGRRVEAEMTLTAVLPMFGRYPEYRFQVGESINEPFHESLPASVRKHRRWLLHANRIARQLQNNDP